MAVLISWDAAPPPGADFYEIRRAPKSSEPFTLFRVVTASSPEPVRYTEADMEGTDSSVYRVQGFRNGVLVSDTGIFQPPQARASGIATRAKVDHDYPQPNFLQYVTSSGKGVEGATIRCFQKPDYVAGRRDVALFITQTDSEGKWLSPFWLEPGMSYIIVFEKRGVCGPDVIEIAV